MVDDQVVAWLVATGIALVFGSVLYWLIVLVPKARLMRCPEAGSVVFVDVESVPGSGDKSSGMQVRQCELWPGRKDCPRGCLERCEETGGGFRVDLHALRPFERRSS